jgi:hypothetical protein
VQKVILHLLAAYPVRRALIVLRQSLDAPDVTALSRGGKTTQFHLPDHAIKSSPKLVYNFGMLVERIFFQCASVWKTL